MYSGGGGLLYLHNAFVFGGKSLDFCLCELFLTSDFDSR
jgi:hypothetical protein